MSFSAGGFSAAYGDRLSSVTQIGLREGSREKTAAQVDLGLTGVGLVAEGPLPGRKGSWVVSGRRSFLDLLVDAIGTGVAPRYSDGQTKVVFDLSSRDHISLLGVGGRDEIVTSRKDAIDDDAIAYGEFRSTEATGGADWQHLWGAVGYSDTSVAFTSTRFHSRNTNTRTQEELTTNRSLETALRARSNTHLKLGATGQVTFGVEAAREGVDYDERMSEYPDPLGQPQPALAIADKSAHWNVGGYGSYAWTPGPLRLSLGLRSDHSGYTGRTVLSPRADLSLRLSSRETVTAAGGVFRQNLPLILLAQNAANRDLQVPTAYHVVLGYSRVFGEQTRLSIEGYAKEDGGLPGLRIPLLIL